MREFRTNKIACCSCRSKYCLRAFLISSIITRYLKRPQGMCYSHLGNGVRNEAMSITQWGYISGCYKVKSITMICLSRDVLKQMIHNFCYVAAREMKIYHYWPRWIMTQNLTKFVPFHLLNFFHYSPCDIIVSFVSFHYFPAVKKHSGCEPRNLPTKNLLFSNRTI